MNCTCAKPTCGSKISPRDFKLECALCAKFFHYKCTQIPDDTSNTEKAAGETYAKKNCFKLYLCAECDVTPISVLVPLLRAYKEIKEIKSEVAVIPSLMDTVVQMNANIVELTRKIGKIDKSVENIESDSKWSDLFKDKSEMLPVTHNVLLKPTNKDAPRGSVFNALKTKLDENEFDLAGCRMNGKNGVVVAAASKESQDKLIARAQELLGVDFQVKSLKEMKPRIKILNAKIPNTWNGSDAAIEKYIKNKNEMLQKAVFVLKIEKRKYVSSIDKAYDIIFQVDAPTFNHYCGSVKNKVKSNWATTSFVEEGIRVKRCMRCLHFGHSKDTCVSQHPSCGKCGNGDHLSKDCKSKDAKCINCVSANRNAKKNLYDVSHNTFSKDCPCYQIQKNKIAKLISYE